MVVRAGGTPVPAGAGAGRRVCGTPVLAGAYTVIPVFFLLCS